jgi:hypothetical protein
MTQRCAVGLTGRKRNDALSVRKKRCAVGSQLVKVDRSEPPEVMGRVPDPQFAEIRQKVQALPKQQSGQP